MVYYNDHLEYLAGQPYFFARKLSPLADRLRDGLDECSAQSRMDTAPQREDIGIRPGEYRRFIERESMGIPGVRTMLRVTDPRMGDLEWNLQEYFVLISDQEQLLQSAYAYLDGRPGLVCHGQLMSPTSIEFAQQASRCGGYDTNQIPIRNQQPLNFWVDVLRESPERHSGYLLLADGAKPYPDTCVPNPLLLARLHARDPRATLVLLCSDRRAVNLEWLSAPMDVPGSSGTAAAQADIEPMARVHVLAATNDDQHWQEPLVTLLRAAAEGAS